MSTTIEYTVNSILTNDARTSADWGGQQLISIDHVSTEGESITCVLMKSGKVYSQPVINRNLLFKPQDRTISPADIHDAVKSLLLSCVKGDS